MLCSSRRRRSSWCDCGGDGFEYGAEISDLGTARPDRGPFLAFAAGAVFVYDRPELCVAVKGCPSEAGAVSDGGAADRFACVDEVGADVFDAIDRAASPARRGRLRRTALTGEQITFDAATLRASLGRAALYRNADVRVLAEEHRAHGREAHTLSGLVTEIQHVRTAVEAVTTNMRRHQVELRAIFDKTRINGSPTYAPPGKYHPG